MFTKFLAVIFFTLCAFAPAFANSGKIENAKQFICKFQEMSHKYDKHLADMYADDAKIVRTVVQSDGQTEDVTLPIDSYKKTLKHMRLLAKIKGYKNYYKDLAYNLEGDNVRITGKRVNTDGYEAPVSILAGKNENNQWEILEEKTNTTSVFLINKVLFK